MVKAFVVSTLEPWRPVEEVEVTLKVCRVYTWAIRANGRRHRAYTTAFPRACMAECRRYNDMLKKFVFEGHRLDGGILSELRRQILAHPLNAVNSKERS